MAVKNRAIVNWRKRLAKPLVLGLVVLSTTIASPALAQLQIDQLLGGSKDQEVNGWLRLGGHEIVEIAAPSTALSKRIEQIEKNLEKIRFDYVQQETMDVQITVVKQTETNLPEIYVNGQYLMTITEADAKSQGNTPWDIVRILKHKLPEVLKRVKTEQKSGSLVIQGAIAGSILLGTALISWLLSRVQKGSCFEGGMEKIFSLTSNQNVSEEQKENLNKAKKMLLPAVQAYLWMGSMLVALSMIPYTRPFQGALLSFLRTPLTIGAIIVAVYVVNHLIYILIERLVRSLVGNKPLEKVMGEPRRQEQRIVSISLVGKSMTRFVLILVGIFLALTTAGINYASVLALAGVIGLIATFVAQSFLKDAVNGLFILVEDQFALDDVIIVENLKLGGIVENLTLRITQIRDVDGRLSTIPNSQIEAVSNLTYQWGRADLKIPVPYDVDINKALAIVKKVAQEMKEDEQWKDIILEEPNILGVDEFAEWRAVIRVWIKSKPIRQWDVLRECHRRIMLAFQEANLKLAVFQHDIRLKTSLPFERETEKEPLKIKTNGKQKTLADKNNLDGKPINYSPEPAEGSEEAGESPEAGYRD